MFSIFLIIFFTHIYQLNWGLLFRFVTLITFLVILSILTRTILPRFLKLMISLSSQVINLEPANDILSNDSSMFWLRLTNLMCRQMNCINWHQWLSACLLLGLASFCSCYYWLFVFNIIYSYIWCCYLIIHIVCFCSNKFHSLSMFASGFGILTRERIHICITMW